ncbi:hypothetical protein HHI36_017029 [Cryptolaemus montrouzieri]|uniref:Endonuclease/exonuclease/phosphatase domain-containing protein n=1 Tax=Cryptolaemus montrouzieri TaxID=559131 RepID=A0ABD2NLN1_9CUCU
MKTAHNCRPTKVGGVALYIRNDLHYGEIEIESPKNCNIYKSLGYQIYVVYRAQKQCKLFFRLLQKVLESSQKLIVIGDLNLDVSRSSNMIKRFKNIVLENHYIIQNTNRRFISTLRNTNKTTIIDHLLTPKSIKKCNMITTDTAISDHKLLYSKIFLKSEDRCVERSKDKKKLSITNYDTFTSYLKANIETSDDFDTFIDIVKKGKMKSTSTKYLSTQNRNDWYNLKIHCKINQRDKA